MLIVYTPYNIAEYIFDGLRTDNPDNHSIIRFGRKKRYSKIKKWLLYKRFSNKLTDLFHEDYIRELQVLAEETDTILLFGVENLKDIIIHRHLFPNHRIIVFMWNVLISRRRTERGCRKFVKRCRAANIDIFTFDENDAGKYGFKTIRQPYRYNPCPETFAPTSDLLFIGQDKGRAEKLLKIKQKCEEAYLTSDLYLIPTKHIMQNAELQQYYHSEVLSYPETLRAVSRHRCYIELLMPGQAGMTLRPYEALAQNRKLLTENANITKFPLYDKTRIMVFDGKTTGEDIKKFLETPFKQLTSEELSYFDINTWLREIEAVENKKCLRIKG